MTVTTIPSAISTQARSAVRPLRRSLMRAITPILLALFAIVGVGLFITLLFEGRDQALRSQSAVLNAVAGALDGALQTPSNVVSELANGRAARQFAQNTVGNTLNDALGLSQTSLISEMTAQLQAAGTRLLALRYVTNTGSVWSEVQANAGSIPVVDPRVRADELASDPLLVEAFNLPVGSIAVGDLMLEGGDVASGTNIGVPIMRFAAPVAAENDAANILGVIVADVAAEPLLNSFFNEATSESASLPGRRVLLVDENGVILADSQNTVDPLFDAARIAGGGGILLGDAQPELAAALSDEGLNAEPVEATLIASSLPVTVPNTNTLFGQLLVTDNPTLLLGANPLRPLLVLLLTLGAGAIAVFATDQILRRLLQPLEALSSRAASPADMSLVAATDNGVEGDEIGQLTGTLALLSQRVETLQTELDQRSQRYARNLDVTSRVGRETAALSDLDLLLNRAIEFICREYGFYHAQVFLIDDVGENAVLVYSFGEVGKRLLEQRFKLPVGSNSVVGTVTETGQAVVVNDTEDSAALLKTPWRFNPLLPETRAEMTLPLQAGTNLLGALDVQSKRANSFEDDDLRTFQLLADQIAVAVQNARLLQQSAQRVEQIDMLNRQLTRVAWEEDTRKSGSAYHYDLLQVEGGRTDGDSPIPAAMSIPITIRGEVVGELAADGDGFSENDEVIMRAVADRVAIAIESARLFEETQTSLAETSTLYQLSRYLSEADSLQDILQAIVIAVMPDATSGQIATFNLDARGGQPDTLTIAAEWSLSGQASAETRTMGTALRVAEHPLLHDLTPEAIVLVDDLSAEPQLDETLRALFHKVGAAALAMVPFSVRGVWRGVILVEFPIVRPFSERERRIYTALIDQAGIAIDNRMLLRENEAALRQIERLYEATEDERSRLRSILETLPAGVLVLDPKTLMPIQYNQQAEQLLGRAIALNQPFDVERYGLFRTGTDLSYPAEEIPILAAARERRQVANDDISLVREDGEETNLLVNAAPIIDIDGNLTAIVAAFEDISALRGLEATLQNNLRETIALYETTRAVSEAEGAQDVVQNVVEQLAVFEPLDVYVLLLDENFSGTRLAGTLSGDMGEFPLPDDLLDAQDAHFAGTLEEAPLSEAAREQLALAGVAAYIAMPMRARSRRGVPLGWIVMTFGTAQVFTGERQQFLNTVTDTAAVALDNRALFRSTEQALQDTASLYSAATAISRVGTLEDLSKALQGALSTLMPDVYAGYLLYADETPVELFNIDLDGAPSPFMTLIEKHNLLHGRGTIFLESLPSNADGTPLERDLIALGNIRAFAMVPMRAKDMPNGALFVAYHQPHRFDTGDARFLNAVADSASVVVDNLLLFEQIQSTLQETSVLYQASRALADADDAQIILGTVVEYLSLRPTNLAFVALLESSDWQVADASVLIAASTQPVDKTMPDLSGLSLSRMEFPAWRLLAVNDVLMLNDVENDADLAPEELAGLARLDLRSISVLPLRVGNRPIGCILLGSREAYVHTERDRRVFRSFAEQASLRLEASRLLAQTERRARQLATSAEVSQIASSILDLSLLMPRIVDTIKTAFSYDHAQIFLMDLEDDYAILRASTGEAGVQLLGIRHRLQKGSASVIGQVTARGEPIIAADTADARVVHKPNPYLPNTRSEMAVPLIVQGRVVGALDVQSNQPNAFDDDDVQVLTTLAAQISVAIDNAQLFNQSQQRANEMSFLFGVTTAAASADTLNAALAQVANELRDSLEALSAAIYLPRQYMDADDNIVTMLAPVALASVNGAEVPLSELGEVDFDSPDLLAAVARSGEPRIIADVEREADYLPAAKGARSAILVPLGSGASFVGLVVVESEGAGAYDNNTLTLLLTLSGTLSAIVQNQSLLEQVQQTNEQLRELDRLKSDFLANMSHELRTPLNSIIGFSRVILKGIDGPLTEMQEQDLSTIYNSGLHLLNLINDILDQAKIAAGKMDMQSDYFDMKAVIDGVRSIGIGLVKDKPIDIQVEIAPGMPKVYGDEFRTRQVLLNLVSNAAKFTREGSIVIVAYPVQDTETGQIFIRTDVTDTGIGIAEKDIPFLFEAFRQVDSSLTRTVGGTGLGLPIAKSLIEMQGGQMLVDSRVNVGSTFSILIPTEPAAQSGGGVSEDTGEVAVITDPIATGEVTALTSTNGVGEHVNGTDPLLTGDKEETGRFSSLKALKNGAEAPASNGGVPDARPEPRPQTGPLRPPMPIKRQILLIEDNPDMVDQFRRSLGREGFDIYTASIPLEAEAMASGLHPTLIIMDVQFSNGEGWNILRRLKDRDDTCDIPVIIVSLTQEEKRVYDAGAYLFIRRPFTPEQLVEAVQNAERDSRIERILIIDDEPESVRLIRELLDEQGRYRVFSAGDGMEGIQLVARRRPDLVIVDLRMPQMSGFEVIHELRGNPETATIPILVVTGDTLNADEIHQLDKLKVIYKTDIHEAQPRHLIDGVKMTLDGVAQP